MESAEARDKTLERVPRTGLVSHKAGTLPDTINLQPLPVRQLILQLAFYRFIRISTTSQSAGARGGAFSSSIRSNHRRFDSKAYT